MKPTSLSFIITAVTLSLTSVSYGFYLPSIEDHSFTADPVAFTQLLNDELAASGSSVKRLDPKKLPPVYRKQLDSVLQDTEGRIAADFRVPIDLKTRVEFWLSIYTLYHSDQFVIFNENHPDIVYDVLDFTELKAKSRNRVAFEIVRDYRVKSLMMKYRESFARLARIEKHLKTPLGATTKGLSPLERKIVTLSQPIHLLDHKHPWAQISKQLRVQSGQREAIAGGLDLADLWITRMDQIFDKSGIPSELTQISMVESSFNPKAISRTGAVGVWQFMQAPAKSFLIMDEKLRIDERRSPVKSGIAAARMLRENYKMLKSWPLAITAYHSGLKPFVGIMKRRAKKADVQKLFDLCEHHGLGWAGKNYYSEFLAVLHAQRYRDWFYGSTIPLNIDKVRLQMVTQSESLVRISAITGTPIEKLLKLNPDIRKSDVALPAGFFVLLPSSEDDFNVASATDWVQLSKNLIAAQRRLRNPKKPGLASTKKMRHHRPISIRSG